MKTLTRTAWALFLTVFFNNGKFLMGVSAWRGLPAVLTNSVFFRGGSYPSEKPSDGSEGETTNEYSVSAAPSDETSLTEQKRASIEMPEDNGEAETRDEDSISVSPIDETSCTEQKGSSTNRMHSSDIMHNLIPKSGLRDDSLELRLLVGTRTRSYVNDLIEAAKNDDEKLPHPRKLLHYLAPKVPAIKHSPDVNLRIRQLRSAIDSGLAASILSTLAWVCEIYDKEIMRQNAGFGDGVDRPGSVAPKIATDRRFEQLVECVLSGVNVKKRKRESLLKQLDRKSDDQTADIEDILDEEDAQEDAGLSAVDACRAAWGIAILGAFHLETLGGEKVMDLLLSLSLRIREILLARLQLLRKDDLFSGSLNDPTQSTESRLDELAEELAQDAACAMWAFGCVKACTGMRSAPLFETCCSLLCQDPVDLRKRAQQGEHSLSNIGASDVVDRLARSDRDLSESDSDDNANKEDQIEQKDALLDWLSPNMVNDILWALALHGSADSTSSDEITLSETATTLREIAFDRLMEWLEEDLALLLKRNEGKRSSVHVDSSMESGSMTVEVVDAATLLESEQKVQSVADAVDDFPVEIEASKRRQNSVAGGVGDVQEVQVVDAAKLLASVKAGGPVELETEVILAPSTVVDSSNIDSDSDFQEDDDFAMDRNSLQSNTESLPSFTPHDLCCMAWAVTELRDQLRPQIVSLITQILMLIGPTSTDGLNGSDLSNLAWAVSKTSSVGERNSASSNRTESVICWVAKSTMKRIRENRYGPSIDVNTVHAFQPPELGRLLWAIASTVSAYSDVSERARAGSEVAELATAALLAASSNLSLFTSEDLLRISWAFLELCDMDTAMANPDIAIALGRVLATVEGTLDRWERGKRNEPTTEAESTHPTAANLFSSFFGKPRLHLKNFDQPISDDQDEEDELSHLLEKSQLPMLRDLSIDPSTLCKAACGVARLSSKHPHLKGSWPLTRVAIRLLSSKNARLLRECSIHDLVRICEAAALSEASGHGRELVVGLFARKVVQLLNDSFDSSSKDASESALNLSQASAAEIASLYWGLGQLGVRHSLVDDHPKSAYRRMRLVLDTPLMTKDSVAMLSSYSAARLLHGLVAMKFASSDRKFLLDVLLEVDKKAESLSGSELCDLVESLAAIRDSVNVGAGTAQSDKKLGDNNKQNGDSSDEFNSTSATLDDSLGSNHSSSPDEDPSGLINADTSVDYELYRTCEDVLGRIVSKVQGQLQSLQADEIKRLLAVFALLPFQADDVVDGIEIEVRKRKQELLGVSSSKLEDLIEEAAALTSSLNRTVFGDSNGVSPLGHIKKGIKSLFSSSEEEVNEAQVQDELENTISEELMSLIQRAAALTSKAKSRVDALGKVARFSIDDVVEDVDQSVALELGRCQELVESYRRIEFSTGTQRSRYDKERRKDISKRVLSRLVPK